MLAELLQPNTGSLEGMSREVGVSVDTLELLQGYRDECARNRPRDRRRGTNAFVAVLKNTRFVVIRDNSPQKLAANGFEHHL